MIGVFGVLWCVHLYFAYWHINAKLRKAIWRGNYTCLLTSLYPHIEYCILADNGHLIHSPFKSNFSHQHWGCIFIAFFGVGLVCCLPVAWYAIQKALAYLWQVLQVLWNAPWDGERLFKSFCDEFTTNYILAPDLPNSFLSVVPQ